MTLMLSQCNVNYYQESSPHEKESGYNFCLRNSESGKFSLVESQQSRTFESGIQLLGIRNPRTNDCDQ